MADPLAGLHAQATRLILSLRDGLERLESVEGGHRQGDSAGIARDLHLKLKELQRTSQELDSTWRLQVMRQNNAKRDVWKRRVEQVAEEADMMRAALDKYGGREQRRQREAADRAELLERAEGGRAAKDEMDAEAGMAASVGSSKRVLAEMFETGTGVLASMGANRERIKATQKKVLDVINSVGLGDRVLRIIERRHKRDAWITYGGMALITLLLVGMLWWRWS